MTTPIDDNIWLGFLDDDPDIAFNALRPTTGSNTFLDYVQGQQSNIYGDYLGGLGRTALAGGSPAQTFTDYLRNFNFRGRFDRLGPRGRGGRLGSSIAPGLVWNI